MLNLNKNLYYIPALTWGIVLGIGSLLPKEALPEVIFWDILSPDKIAHLGAYAILLFLISWGLHHNDKLNRKSLTVAALLGITYGISMEYGQHYLSVNRQFEWLDALANTLGCFLGIWSFTSFFK